MKIIIVGLGQIGSLLAQRIPMENHDATVIDADKEKIEDITNLYNVNGICGSGASREILLKAGAATADIIISVSSVDEVNLMSCMIAKDCGTRYAMAKIDQPELSGDKDYLKNAFQIDSIINPKLETALEMHRQIFVPGELKADAYFSDVATIIRLRLTEKLVPAQGLPMKEIKGVFGTDMLIATVTRGRKLYIPKGDFVLQAGDVVGVIAADTAIPQIAARLGAAHKPVKRAMLVGGGTTAYYLGKKLLEDHKSVTILESDAKRCAELAELLPEANVSYANGIDTEILLEEGLDQMDSCISMTGKDDTNMVISLFAWSMGVKSIITRINTTAYEKLLNKVNIDITILPALISANHVLGFIRNLAVHNEKGNDIQCLYQLAGGMAEATEFIAYDNCRKLGIAFRQPELQLKKDILIAMIIHEGQVIIPDGNSRIQQGDRVIVISKKGNGLNTLNDIFHG